MRIEAHNKVQLEKVVANPSDLKLAQDCIAHNEEAWAELMQRCRNFCKSIAYQYNVRHQYDDLFSKFVMKLLGDGQERNGALSKYDGSALLTTYCYFIFKNLTLNFIRDTHRQTVKRDNEIDIDTYEQPSAGGNPVVEASEKNEMAAILSTAMDYLAADERRIIELYYFQQMTVRQIGATLDCNASTVSRKLSRIYENLKKILKHKLGFENVPL